MRKTVLIILSIFFSLTVSAQTYLKWNTVYWSLGIINTSVETRIAQSNFTFNCDAVFSPWKSVLGNPMMIGQIIPEFRYYVKNANDGFYAGAYGSFHGYRMTKWNYIGKKKYQVGHGYSFGLNLGYQIPVNERLLVDFFWGGGWQHSTYKGYYTQTGEKYVDWNYSGEWIPYKIGVAIGYRIGMRKSRGN